VEPVFRPELRQATSNSRKSGNRFSVRNCVKQRAIPGKVETGFPSGIASSKEQSQEKCEAAFGRTYTKNREQFQEKREAAFCVSDFFEL
jgi:hypothetical protein